MSKKSFKDNPALQFISAPAQTEQEPVEKKPTAEAPEIVPSKRDVPEGMKLNPLFVEKRTQRAQFVLQPSVYKKAKELAKARGISFNDFVHGLIEDEIERAGNNG